MIEIRKPVIIVTGGSASGKTLLVNTIKDVQNLRRIRRWKLLLIKMPKIKELIFQ